MDGGRPLTVNIKPKCALRERSDEELKSLQVKPASASRARTKGQREKIERETETETETELGTKRSPLATRVRKGP